MCLCIKHKSDCVYQWVSFYYYYFSFYCPQIQSTLSRLDSPEITVLHCLLVGTHTHTHARTHTCMHVCTHARTHTHRHTHTDTHTHTHTQTQTHTHTDTHTHRHTQLSEPFFFNWRLSHSNWYSTTSISKATSCVVFSV